MGMAFRGGFFKKKLQQTLGIGVLVAACLVVPARAKDEEKPFWGSIKAEVANARVGPSTEYPIIWIYKRRLLPLKVIRTHGPWWQVEDPDGAQSWIFARLLSSSRTALVRGSTTSMHAQPDGSSRVLWRLEPGVVGKLGECEEGWCPFDVNGRAGYVLETALWGTAEL